MTPAFLSTFYFFLFGLFLFIILVPFSLRIEADNLRDNKIIRFELFILLLSRLKMIHIQRDFNWFCLFQERIDPLLFKINSMEKKDSGIIFGLAKEFLINCLKIFLKRISFKLFRLQLRIGTGNPAWTGIITGLLRFIGSLVVNRVKLRQNAFSLVTYPSFYRSELSVELQFEFIINGVKIILFLLECGKAFFILINQYYRRRLKCQIDLSRV